MVVNQDSLSKGSNTSRQYAECERLRMARMYRNIVFREICRTRVTAPSSKANQGKRHIGERRGGGVRPSLGMAGRRPLTLLEERMLLSVVGQSL